MSSDDFTQLGQAINAVRAGSVLSGWLAWVAFTRRFKTFKTEAAGGPRCSRPRNTGSWRCEELQVHFVAVVRRNR